MDVERAKAVAAIVATAAANVANVLGWAVDAEAWVNAATGLLAAGLTVWSWWRNNNVTEEAQRAQGVLDRLKAERRALRAGGGRG